MSRHLARRRRPAVDDRGFSLMEVMVGSALMSTVMAIASAGFVQMYHATEKADSAATAQASLSDTFAKLDREVRYAYRINPAYQVGTTSFAVDYVIDDDADALQCVQLTLPIHGGALLRRQWPVNSTSADIAAVTTGIATDLVPGTPNVNPFTVTRAPATDSNFDRLLMTVNSTVGVPANGSTRSYRLQFTALNTTLNDPANTTCTKG